ncbi:MAG: hypothetical protein ABIB71_01345 [Candidatus Woesearchaeota archaeon]
MKASYVMLGILLILICIPLVISKDAEKSNINYNPADFKNPDSIFNKVSVVASDKSIDFVEKKKGDSGVAFGSVVAGKITLEKKEIVVSNEAKAENQEPTFELKRTNQLLTLKSKNIKITELEKELPYIVDENKFYIYVETQGGNLEARLGKSVFNILCGEETEEESEEEKEECIISLMITKENIYANIKGKAEINVKDGAKIEVLNLNNIVFNPDAKGKLLDFYAVVDGENVINGIKLDSCVNVCQPVRYEHQGKNIKLSSREVKIYESPDGVVYGPSGEGARIYFGTPDHNLVKIVWDEVIYKENGCKTEKKPCISIRGNDVEINPKSHTGIFFSPPAAYGGMLTIHEIPKRDGGVVTVSNEDKSREMIFDISEVTIAPSNVAWFEFGTSFTSHPYLPNKKEYGDLICRLEDKKCTLDGEPITGPTELGAKKCGSKSDCSKEEDCVEGFCVEKAKCLVLSELMNDNSYPSKGPIDVVFVAVSEKGSKTDFLGIVDVLKDTMFKTDPYSYNKNKFNFLYMDIGAPSSDFSDSSSLMIELVNKKYEKCPNAEIVIGLIENSGKEQERITSSASKDLNAALLYKHHTVVAGSGWEGYPFLHEFSHIMGLKDEYHMNPKSAGKVPLWSWLGKQPNIGVKTGPNCISTKEQAEKQWGWKLEEEGKDYWTGCGGICLECVNFLRPSENSIMGNRQGEKGGHTFNKPSIAHINNRLGGVSK